MVAFSCTVNTHISKEVLVDQSKIISYSGNNSSSWGRAIKINSQINKNKELSSKYRKMSIMRNKGYRDIGNILEPVNKLI